MSNEQEEAASAEATDVRIMSSLSQMVESQADSIDEINRRAWDESDNQANPYNWKSTRKVTIGLLCSTSQLVTTMSASMIVPALGVILQDLNMDAFSGQIAFSVFFLGLGFAPFVVAPLSEMYGRRPVWLAGNVFYILWNSLSPVGRSPALMVLARFLSASGASVGVTLTSPILADIYGAKDRGTALAIASLLPYVGLAIGPIIGGVAGEYLVWPWLFWILSITNTCFTILGFVSIPETFAPVLQQRFKTGIDAKSAPNLKSISVRQMSKMFVAFTLALRAPMRLFLFRPVIQLLALALGLEFGIYTLVLGSYATLWQERYSQSTTTASLHYISIATGALLCSFLGRYLMGWTWRHMKAANPDRDPTPEYRIPYMVIGIIPCTAGLFWYGWAAQTHAPWPVVDLGIVVFVLGAFMFAQAVSAYILDEFPQKLSASASAATRLGTYVFGFVLPIFGPRLHQRLGYAWGYSLLGFLFLILAVLITLLLHIRGSEFREKGRSSEEYEKMR